MRELILPRVKSVPYLNFGRWSGYITDYVTDQQRSYQRNLQLWPFEVYIKGFSYSIYNKIFAS